MFDRHNPGMPDTVPSCTVRDTRHSEGMDTNETNEPRTATLTDEDRARAAAEAAAKNKNTEPRSRRTSPRHSSVG